MHIHSISLIYLFVKKVRIKANCKGWFTIQAKYMLTLESERLILLSWSDTELRGTVDCECNAYDTALTVPSSAEKPEISAGNAAGSMQIPEFRRRSRLYFTFVNGNTMTAEPCVGQSSPGWIRNVCQPEIRYKTISSVANPLLTRIELTW